MFQIQANNEINSAQPDPIGEECFAFHSQMHKPGRKYNSVTFLVAQHLRLCASKAGDVGSIPGHRNKIPHAVQCSQKILKIIIIKTQTTELRR